MRHEVELPRAEHAPARARRMLAQWYGRALDTDELDAAKLVVSEFVNNAVLHGEGGIRLRADLDEHRLVVEVIDGGSGFEHAVRKLPFSQVSGRGLAIVDAVSSRWGIQEGTTHVWAELERTEPRPNSNAALQ